MPKQKFESNSVNDSKVGDSRIQILTDTQNHHTTNQAEYQVGSTYISKPDT